MNYPYPTLTPRVPLKVALERVSDYLHLDSNTLYDYAQEDTIGGYHHDKELRTFEGGIWGVEGQVLYALVRALKPQNVLEIGNYYGCSTLHIADALLANGSGKMTTLDFGLPYGPKAAEGKRKYRIPKKYVGMMKSVTGDLMEFNYATRPKIDFIFEDAYHNEEQISHVWGEFQIHGKKGGLVVSHDSEHYLVGEGVQEGIKQVVAADAYLSVAIDPADCGLAMWRKA